MEQDKELLSRSPVHPQVDSEEKGERRHGGVLDSSQRCRLSWLPLWRGVLRKSLEAVRVGSLPVRAATAVSSGKSSTESCSAGLRKRSRLVTAAFSE